MNDTIQEISREGFQVVSGDMFRRALRVSAPTVTLWPNRISFSKAALVALNNCERVRFEVNASKRCMLVVPVTEKDKDNVRWTKNSKEPAVRMIECLAFTSQLYESWHWKNELAYRTTGRIVSADKKVMLLFDFNDAESWKYKDKEKAN